MLKPPLATLNPPVGPGDHAQGQPDARVTLVEYGDYQCPHCKAAVKVIAQLKEKFGADLRLVFRHFPLGKMHPFAKLAAEAAESAAVDGKFWEMHELLYRDQSALAAENLLQYAGEIGLDVERVKADLESHVHEARVRADLGGGIRSGVNGTPTFFVNGRRHVGGYAVEGLTRAIEAQLSAKA